MRMDATLDATRAPVLLYYDIKNCERSSVMRFEEGTIMIKRISLPSLFIALGFCLVLSSAAADAADAGLFDPNQMIDLEKMHPKGTWEEVTWPDTLDLAARAELSLNGLTRNSNAHPPDSAYPTFDFAQNPPTTALP